MLCPVCTDIQLAISSREGVEIDHCPQCRGVWLDRGELDKILDRAAASMPPPPPPAAGPQERPRDDRRDRRDDRDRDRDDDRRRDDERRRKRKRRAGWLEELFDFD